MSDEFISYRKTFFVISDRIKIFDFSSHYSRKCELFDEGVGGNVGNRTPHRMEALPDGSGTYMQLKTTHKGAK